MVFKNLMAGKFGHFFIKQKEFFLKKEKFSWKPIEFFGSLGGLHGEGALK